MFIHCEFKTFSGLTNKTMAKTCQHDTEKWNVEKAIGMPTFIGQHNCCMNDKGR